MSKFLKFGGVACAMFVIFVGGAFAQTKIGVVDWDRVLVESNAGKSMASGLKSVMANIGNELSTPQKNLVAEQNALEPLTKSNTKEQIASDPALLSRFKNFDEQLKSYAVLEQKSKQEMELTRRKSLADFNIKAIEAVEHVRQQKGLEIVFNKGQYISASSSIDVTSDVIAHLNKVAPSITVKRVPLPQRVPANK